MKDTVHDWFDDDGDRGVSPVIGVILMVAITVILAAVIGTFVLNLSNQTGNTAPQTSLSFSLDTKQSGGNITVSHAQGDKLKLEKTEIIITNESSGDVFRVGVNETDYDWTIGEEMKINTTGDNVAPATVGDDSRDATVFRDGHPAYDDGNDDVFDDGGTGTFKIVDDVEYTIKVIDKESDKQVAATTIEG